MKQRKIWAWVMALAMAACLAPLAPTMAAQNQGSSAKQPAAAQKQNRKKTYYGKVVKLQNGKFALMINAKAHRGYFLDDQKHAKKYAQKNVLVTGTVDPKTSILHVAAIKPAFQK
jgi:hypothetical protein